MKVINYASPTKKKPNNLSLNKKEILRIVQLQISENREANQEGGGEQDEGKVNENGNIEWLIDAQRT